MNFISKFIKKISVNLRRKKNTKHKETTYGNIQYSIVYCNDYLKYKKLDIPEDRDISYYIKNLSNIIFYFNINSSNKDSKTEFEEFFNIVTKMGDIKFLRTEDDDNNIHFVISSTISNIIDILFYYYQYNKIYDNNNKFYKYLEQMLYTLPIDGFESLCSNNILYKEKFVVDEINYVSKMYSDNFTDIRELGILDFDNPKFFSHNMYDIFGDDILYLSNIYFLTTLKHDDNYDVHKEQYSLVLKNMCICKFNVLKIIDILTNKYMYKEYFTNIEETLCKIFKMDLSYFTITEDKTISALLEKSIKITDDADRANDDDLYADIDEIID